MKGAPMSYEGDVIKLLQEVGVPRLSAWDGCTCGTFEVRRVKIDVSCGKGRERGVWVSSHSCDFTDSEYKPNEHQLRPIGDEVARQVSEGDQRGPVPVHIGEWQR
jgi:hypothetical protein